MATTAVATLQTTWDCKWSRAGYRLTGVSERVQPETIWVCVRTGDRRNVDEAECQGCPFWQKDGAR
jgi:hypothetical protein